MKSKLFYLFLATFISCSGAKDSIKSTNNNLQSKDVSKKRLEEELKMLKEKVQEIEEDTKTEKVIEKAKEVLKEQLAQEEVKKKIKEEKIKKEAEDELKRLEEIALKVKEKRISNEAQEENQKQGIEEKEKLKEKLSQEEFEKKLKEEKAKEFLTSEDLKREVDEEVIQIKTSLKEELVQKTVSSLTSSEIDAKVTQAKQDSQKTENPFKKAIETRKSLSLSEIEEKINEYKQPVFHQSPIAESLTVNSMLENVNQSLVQEPKEDLTESTIQRENIEWGISSSTLNDSYINNELLYNQVNNNDDLMNPLEGQKYADLFKHTARGSSLTSSTLGKIIGRRSNFSDSQIDDNEKEDLESSQEDESKIKNLD